MAEQIVIKSGEVVRFPVASDHPLAKYQQLLDVSQVPNLHELAIVRRLRTANPNLPPSAVVAAVQGILRSSGVSTIFTQLLPDITIEQGATAIYDGPVTQIAAGKVSVQGEMIVYGSLNLTCTELDGVIPPSSSGGGGGSSSGGGGGTSGFNPPPHHGPVEQ
jgi:hypothetical protein